MCNVKDSVVPGKLGQFASVSLAALIAMVLSGCSVAPGDTKPPVRKAVAKSGTTYVVKRAAVRTPGTHRVRKYQQQHTQNRTTSPVSRQQAARAQLAARKKVAAQRTQRITRNHKGQKPLTSAQYHARYKAQKQLAAQAALKKRQAKARALAVQQQTRQQAIRRQHIAKWEQQQNKRRQYNNSWKYKQAQKAAQQKKQAQVVRRRPAAPVRKTHWAKPRPATRPVVRKQHQPNRQKYIARWERQQAEKRLAIKRRQAEQRLAAKKRQAQKYQAAHEAAQKVERVINNAQKQIGRKYVWGGASPKRGFDCSGLVQHSIRKGANVRVPRTAAQQYKAAVKVPKHQAQRGDLVFFITRGKSVSHVGIYLGNNTFVHAPRTGKRVTKARLSGYWKKRFVGFGRIPGACRLPV